MPTSNTQCNPLGFLLVVTAILKCCLAYSMAHTDVSNTSYYQDLARRNVIVVDQPFENDLRRRADTTSTTTSTSGSASNSVSVLPRPFDTSLGSNFTDTTCPTFFQRFLNDVTFQSCLPVSLLLQNSMSFFQTARSSSSLQLTLDQSCSASLAVCSPLMSKLAGDLISLSNCHTDYVRENPLVLQAYAGLRAYEPLYKATCLKNETTDEYCFVEAMDTPNEDDSYPYYTAVGMQLPNGSSPTCSPCLKRTSEVFAGYAVQKEQPLSDTYLGSATQINSQCGANFASTQLRSVSKVTTNSATRTSKSGNVFTILVIMALTVVT